MGLDPGQISRRDRPQSGFDFTLHIRRICDDMVVRLDELHHIDMTRVAVSFSQTRRTGSLGMFASLTPLRFAGGQMHTVRRKRRWGDSACVQPRRPGNAVHPELLPSAVLRSALPREARHNASRALAHRSEVRRRRASVGRSLFRPREVEKGIRRLYRDPCWIVGFRSPPPNRSTISSG